MNEKVVEKLLNPPPNGKIAAANEFGVDLTLLACEINLATGQRIEKMQIRAAQFKLWSSKQKTKFKRK